MWIATFRLHTAGLLQAMGSTGHAWSYKARCSAVISCFSTAVIGAFRSLLISDLLPRRSAVARLSCCWSINILYFVPEWLVSGVVGMLWNSRGLGTGESNVSIVLLNSVLHRSLRCIPCHIHSFCLGLSVSPMYTLPHSFILQDSLCVVTEEEIITKRLFI